MSSIVPFFTQHLMLSFAFLIVVFLLLIVEFLRANRSSAGLNPQQVTRFLNHQNAIVLDIRPPEAYRQGHIIDAQSVVTTELRQNPKKIEKYKNRPLILVCASGLESQKVALQLQKQGFQAYCLRGGLRSWTDAHLPLVKE